MSIAPAPSSRLRVSRGSSGQSTRRMPAAAPVACASAGGGTVTSTRSTWRAAPPGRSALLSATSDHFSARVGTMPLRADGSAARAASSSTLTLRAVRRPVRLTTRRRTHSDPG